MATTPQSAPSPAAPPAPEVAPEKGRSLLSDAWRRLRKNKLALVSLGFIFVVATVGYSAPLFSANVTFFSPDEQHSALAHQPPGTKTVSTDHPTYDGDARAFDLVDFDGDGYLTCHRLSPSNVLPPGFRQLERLSPTLHAEAVAAWDDLDERVGAKRIVAVVLGRLECPELRVAQEVAKHLDNLFNSFDRAAGAAEPDPAMRQSDGYLTWAEFPKYDGELPEDVRGYGLAGPDAFRQLDVNGDNVISQWEVTERSRYFRYASLGNVGGLSFENFIMRHDSDRDLRIARGEFPGAPKLRTFAFGTDAHGRDVLTRLIYGARLSITVGLLATLVSLLIGVTYGAVSGYVGGRTDYIMMRIVDVLYGLPFMFLVILLMVMFGRNVIVLFIALGAVQWLNMARVVRGQIISLKTREFIEAARAMGTSSTAIVFRHLIRNAIGPVVVYATLLVPAAIMQEAFLSFLGLLGDEISWGKMISEALEVFQSYPWLIVFPGAALAVTLFAMNFLGDGVRDAIDVKQT